MVTGVEIAGLILATAPLVVSFLERYRKGLEPFQRWARYRKDIKRLTIDIRLEVDKFLLTFEHLLEGTVLPDQLTVLLHEPNNALWHSHAVQASVHNLLGVAYESFCESLYNFYEALFELHKKLEQGLDGQTLHPDRSGWDCALDRIKYSLSREKHAALKATLKDSNKVMRKLTFDSNQLVPARKNRKLQAVDFPQIRDSADGLYNTLENGPWGCYCSEPHNANLRLENRIKLFKEPMATHHQQPLQLRFRVLFNRRYIGDWRETEIVPRERSVALSGCNTNAPRSSPQGESNLQKAPTRVTSSAPSSILIQPSVKKAKTCKSVRINADSNISHKASPISSFDPVYRIRNLQMITSLCAILQQVAEGHGWLGCLPAQGNSRQYDLMAIRHHPRGHRTGNSVKLSDLFVDDNSKLSSANSYRLNWFDRRYLALCLASTVLQLYDTPWLGRNWCASDILFVRQLSADGRPLIKQPFVSRAFAAQRQLIPAASRNLKRPCRLIRNQTVFDLGFVLIELCFRKPLHSFQTSEDRAPDGKCTEFTDYLTATRMIDKVTSKAGVPWGRAVRRCLYCEFDQSTTSLSNQDFRQAVYQGVVKELENDLRHYCGGELPDEE